MSAEQLTSIDIVDTFTPKQKEQWETIAPFFENGRKITISTFFEPGKPKEFFIDCLEEGFMETIIKGTLEETVNNQDSHLVIAQAMIANGSAQINVDLNRS